MGRMRIAVALLVVAGAGCESGATAPEPSVANGAATGATFRMDAGVAGSATGSAHLTVFPPPVPPGLGLRNFAFSAMRYGDGSVAGQWQVTAGASILHGPIDCLTIAPDGTSARISGLVADAKFSIFLEGTAFAMELFDDGDGASGDPDVTTQIRAFRNLAPEVGREFCENGTVPPGADLDPLPTEHGNLTIQLYE